MRSALLRVHRFLPLSHVNGPGRRAVLWVQGCSLGCPGCFNPETHSFAHGDLVPVDLLFDRIVHHAALIERITVSGGEPLQQRRPLHALLRRLRSETSLSVLLFTGYTWEEVQRMGEPAGLLAYIDVLIAGRYDAARHLARDLRGSDNQTVHFLTRRYSEADLQRVPPAEVIITPQGEIVVSGIDPVRLG